MKLTPPQKFWAKVAVVAIVAISLAYFLPEKYVIMKPKAV